MWKRMIWPIITAAKYGLSCVNKWEEANHVLWLSKYDKMHKNMDSNLEMKSYMCTNTILYFY